MVWSSWAEFWAMGGYGLYVWGSYAVVFAWLLLESLLERRAHQRAVSQSLEETE